VYHATLQPGDELVLRTDGLTRKLPDATIREILDRSDTPKVACDALVAAANEAGEDSIAIVVARLLPVAQSDTTPPDGVRYLRRCDWVGAPPPGGKLPAADICAG
jgi:protein phosphatase